MSIAGICNQCDKPITRLKPTDCFYCKNYLCYDCWLKYDHCVPKIEIIAITADANAFITDFYIETLSRASGIPFQHKEG